MAKAGTSEEASAAATSLAGSTPTPRSSKAASIAPAESLIYVVHDSGDAEVDSICSGIHVGDWNTDIVPHITKGFASEQLDFSKVA